MAFRNGNPYTGFRGINIEGPADPILDTPSGGYLRFGGTVTASLSNSGDLGIYPTYTGQRVYFKSWNGTVEAILDPSVMKVQSDVTGTQTMSIDLPGLILTDTTSSITITLPSASAVKGLTYTIVNQQVQPITFKVQTGDGLDNAVNGTIYGDGTMDAIGDMIQFTADGSGTWYITSRYIH